MPLEFQKNGCLPQKLGLEAIYAPSVIAERDAGLVNCSSNTLTDSGTLPTEATLVPTKHNPHIEPAAPASLQLPGPLRFYNRT
ncbi:hypothetical protein D3C76_375300 [compost metagenome]